MHLPITGTRQGCRSLLPLKMNSMNDLASRLARGEYEIDEHRVAEAILRRRGNGLLMLVPSELDRPAAGGPEDDTGPGLSAA